MASSKDSSEHLADDISHLSFSTSVVFAMPDEAEVLEALHRTSFTFVSIADGVIAIVMLSPVSASSLFFAFS